MTKIDVFSGFLGAGKTTLIKKLIAQAYAGEKLVLIENEFGQVGIDGGFLKEAGIEITEMNSGCICCSLVGDFKEALEKVLVELTPDRILIEPSGVGKLSDVIRAVEKVVSPQVQLNALTTVADATKCKIYSRNFGEFYNDQIAHASCIVLSRTDGMNEEKLAACVEKLRQSNPTAAVITTPWEALDGKQILAAMERQNTLKAELDKLAAEEACPACGHGHHHDHEERDCHDHEHHHHDHEECDCHDHEHHHHADDVFASWGAETARHYSEEDIRAALEQLADGVTYGVVLRAKGIVAGEDGRWIHFDYVPGAPDVRFGGADVIGRLCVIGSGIHEEALAELFCVASAKEK